MNNLSKQMDKLQADMLITSAKMRINDSEAIREHGMQLMGAAGMVATWIREIKKDDRKRE